MRLESFGGKPRFQGPAWLFPRQVAISLHGDGSRLFQRVSEYNPRKLTRGSDILNAMLGIFQWHSSLPKPVYHRCGVPIMAQHPYYEEGDKLNLRGFGSGLCWRLLHRATRRADFTSWPWTGWKGIVIPDGMVKYCERGGTSTSDLGITMRIFGYRARWKASPLEGIRRTKQPREAVQIPPTPHSSDPSICSLGGLREFYGNRDSWRAPVDVGHDVMEG